MVRSLINYRPFSPVIPNLDLLFDEFFGSWPIDRKPPIDKFPIMDPDNMQDSLKGWNVQLALAGFNEDDLKVWFTNDTLHIEGDNTYRDTISEKFKSKFHHEIKVYKTLDLDNTEVLFENGILDIKIPIKEIIENKKLLFGKD